MCMADNVEVWLPKPEVYEVNCDVQFRKVRFFELQKGVSVKWSEGGGHLWGVSMALRRWK